MATRSIISFLLVTTTIHFTSAQSYFEQAKETLCRTCSDDILVVETVTGYAESVVYKWPDLLKAVDSTFLTGIGDMKLYMGDESSNGYKYGLTNIAAFLAQSMKESIKYDACDENNWDNTDGYAASNACGQLGQSYQDYNCQADEEHMQCDVDPNMEIRAETHAVWYGAPPAMFCAPKSKLPASPRWDHGGWCNPADNPDVDKSFDEYIAYVASGGSCEDYLGQKAGSWTFCPNGGCPNYEAPLFGQEARTDVEGCCWWGRGVIQTTGVCNFGKLNYYLGARAANEGRPSLFPDVNFCQDPEQICTTTKYPELKWIAGFFYWLESVQTYEQDGWNYLAELRRFVDDGFPNPGSDGGFIHGASGIVNRGCHNPPACGTGTLDGGSDRAQNFQTILTVSPIPITVSH
eukprot:gene3643-4578_t